MMNHEYALGLAVGVFTGLIIFALIWKFSKRKMKGTFDERQELVRGRGYKYAMFTILALMLGDLLLESLDIIEALPVTRELLIFFIVLISIMVYALYCIKNDSYFGVGTDTRSYRVLMWVIIACNLFSGVTGIRDGAMIDGKFAFGPCAALLFVAAFLIIMIALYVKKHNAAIEEAAEDEL